MHDTQGWLLDARLSRIVLAAWMACVLLYGFWRSRGAATQDATRPSGPIL